jgi:prepilin-type N-terminal cleavage/methylation domain-containing protein
MRMRMSLCRRAGRGGFTLVELVTVMGILAILITLVVGAGKGVWDGLKRDATRETIKTLEMALGSYFADWGKYPWIKGSTHELMGQVDWEVFAEGGYQKENVQEICLHSALNMTRRSGPYMKGGSKASTVELLIVNRTALAYADAWGRPILYREPTGNHKMPRLISQGPLIDFPNDPESEKDNIANYD